MLLFQNIVDPCDGDLAEIKSLYENSFPKHERRVWEVLLQLLAEPQMFLVSIRSDEQFVGFVIYWKLADWLYVEHLAIVPQLRGKQLGSEVVGYLLKLSPKKTILETELPIDEDGFKRIRFYQKLGFKTLDYLYNQPPYRIGESPFPMKLMCTTDLTRTEYEEVVNLIRKMVYERFY